MPTIKESSYPVLPSEVGNNLAEGPKVFYAVFAVCTLLHLTLALSSRLYPHIDLPFHLAAATIYKYYGSPANDFSQFFEVNVFLSPNTLFLFFTSLDVFPSVEAGNKVFYALYLLLFPVSVLLLIRQLGGNKWYALFSFLLIYNFNVNFGFVNFYFAIPLVLLLFYFILRSLQTESAWDKAAVAGLLLLIYFTHALATIFALIIFGVIYGFCYRRSLKKLALAGLMVLPTLGLLTYWWSSSQSEADTVGFLIDYYRQEYLSGFKNRVAFFSMDNFYLFSGKWGWIAGAFFTFLMHLPLAWWVLAHYKSLPQQGQWKRNGALYLFILASLGVFFLGPNRLPDEMHYLYQRFSVFIHVGFILLASVLVGRQYQRQVLVLAGVAFLLHFGAYAERQFSFEKDSADFTPGFLPSEVKGKKFAGILLDVSFRGRSIYEHFPNYQITWHQGVTASKALDFRFNSLRRKPGAGEAIPRYQYQFTSSGGSSANPYAGFADYIFVRGRVDEKTSREELGDYHLVRTSGKWSLRERNGAL
ncbi:hypothetical protein BH24BAC1_BH24BAC1_15200 [soil metagenome]